MPNRCGNWRRKRNNDDDDGDDRTNVRHDVGNATETRQKFAKVKNSTFNMKTNCQLRIGAAKPTATVAETLTETDTDTETDNETADNIRLNATLRPVGWELCTEECPKPTNRAVQKAEGRPTVGVGKVGRGMGMLLLLLLLSFAKTEREKEKPEYPEPKRESKSG